jgi:hypothetical protein
MKDVKIATLEDALYVHPNIRRHYEANAKRIDEWETKLDAERNEGRPDLSSDQKEDRR